MAPHERYLRVARLELRESTGHLIANELQVRCAVCAWTQRWSRAAHEGHVRHEGLLVHGQVASLQLPSQRLLQGEKSLLPRNAAPNDAPAPVAEHA